MTQSTPITVAIVGAGHRSVGYANYALSHPELMRVVAVAEPNPNRRGRVAKSHDIPPSRQFDSYTDLAARPGLVHAVINGTMDELHYASSIPLIEAGFNMLLEKPIAPTEQQVRELIKTAQCNEVTVMICHVLRYTPFYRKIKQLLNDGAIGDTLAFTTTESINYHHTTTPFVRGRWRQRKTNPIMLAKCCHDLDIIAWLMSDVKVRNVSSFGGLKQFRSENAPPGSAERCLNGCEIESTCIHSARTNYITQGLWECYAWESIEHIENPTVEDKLESLRTDNPFGRCVWHCDNDVADHQSVLIQFENGVTATHNLFAGGARIARTIYIVGTQGEIEGDLADDRVTLRKPNLKPGQDYTAEHFDVRPDRTREMLGHAGGDENLVADFVNVVAGGQPSVSCTNIRDSLTGHLIAFAADIAMQEQRVVQLS